MLQQKEADDYVIATGASHTVREFAAEAFQIVGLDWKKHVRVDRSFKRPAEVARLLGDASKARRKLGWRARTMFRDLVKIMVKPISPESEHRPHENRAFSQSPIWWRETRCV